MIENEIDGKEKANEWNWEYVMKTERCTGKADRKG